MERKYINYIYDIFLIYFIFGNKSISDYDIKICAWGASIGKEVQEGNSFAKEFCIKIINKDLKDKILKLLKSVKWTEEYAMTSTPNLLQWQVIKYLKKNVVELK